MRPLFRPFLAVVREPTLFERVKGDIVIIGAKRVASFVCVHEDNEVRKRFLAIPRSGVISNTHPDYRIFGVPDGERHRLQWVTGSCAPSPVRLAALAAVIPEVRRYLRRQRIKRLWRKVTLR